jgi:heptosyltransferase-3
VTRDDDFSRILVICTRQLGDVLLTTPLIRAAKQRWPKASIDVLGFGGTLGMLAGNPDVHATIEVGAGSGWLRSLPLIVRLWRRYDLALVAQYSDRAHLYGFVAGRVRSGQVLEGREGGWQRALLHHVVRIDRRRVTHAVIEKLRLLEPWTKPALARLVAPAAAPLPEDAAAALFAPYVVLQVPSLVRYKQWPVAHFAALARLLGDDGVQVVLSGGPARVDREACAQVAAAGAAPPPIDLCGRLSLPQLATLLAAAAAYVGPDTSITHLAAAVGTPVVALYGPISPRLWGPWPGEAGLREAPFVDRAARQQAGRVIVLQGPSACVPCNRAGCENHNASRSECLELLAPERVAAELRRLLRGEDPTTT